MLGKVNTLVNNFLAGALSGVPWGRQVRKGLIISTNALDNEYEFKRNIVQIYNQEEGKLAKLATQTLQSYGSFINPAETFANNMSKVKGSFAPSFRGGMLIDSSYMYFMYNPTNWTRTIQSGMSQINIPGNKPVFHNAHIPPQKFTLDLLLDSSIWYNGDDIVNAIADTAIGFVPYVRETQLFHTPPKMSDPFQATEASLAPIIHWYERLCFPNPVTRKIPTVLVAYQDLIAVCFCDSCSVTVLRSDWQQNINRATVNLAFTVLKNFNIEEGTMYKNIDQFRGGIDAISTESTNKEISADDYGGF